MSEDMKVIHGPQVLDGGGVLFQVTLEKGLVLTKPADFGLEATGMERAPVFSEQGRLLTPVSSRAF
jgi:hypothetical protein